MSGDAGELCGDFMRKLNFDAFNFNGERERSSIKPATALQTRFLYLTFLTYTLRNAIHSLATSFRASYSVRAYEKWRTFNRTVIRMKQN